MPYTLLLQSTLSRALAASEDSVWLPVEPHVVTDEDRKVISEAIAYYKAHGKFKEVASPKRASRTAKKKVKK